MGNDVSSLSRTSTFNFKFNLKLKLKVDEGGLKHSWRDYPGAGTHKVLRAGITQKDNTFPEKSGGRGEFQLEVGLGRLKFYLEDGRNIF